MSGQRPQSFKAHAYHAGIRAEWWAALLLMAKGYRILTRRYAAAGGEIDIVARRGATVVFVEVKARALRDDAMIAITPAKERRIRGTIRHWLVRNDWAMSLTLRCDAVFLGARQWPRHVEDVMTIYLD